MGSRLCTLGAEVAGQNIIARNGDLAEHQLIGSRVLYRYVLCGTSRSQVLDREIETCWYNLNRSRLSPDTAQRRPRGERQH